MKKISLFVFLSFLVLFLLVGCVKREAPLVKYGDNNDWVNYSSDNYGNVYSYKMKNIQNNGGKYIVQVWEKEVYSDKGEEEIIQKMTKNGLSTEGYDKLKETMSLYEIDCNKKMKNISSITDYDMEGKVLLSYSYDKKEWGFIVPDSKVDSFRKEVCK